MYNEAVRWRASGSWKSCGGGQCERQTGELEVYFRTAPCLTCVSYWVTRSSANTTKLRLFDLGNSNICANIFAPQVFPHTHAGTTVREASNEIVTLPRDLLLYVFQPAGGAQATACPPNAAAALTQLQDAVTNCGAALRSLRFSGRQGDQGQTVGAAGFKARLSKRRACECSPAPCQTLQNR